MKGKPGKMPSIRPPSADGRIPGLPVTGHDAASIMIWRAAATA